VKRPAGLTVLVALLLIGAVFRFVVSFTDFGVGSTLAASGASPGSVPPEAAPAVAALGNLGIWIGVVSIAVAVLMILAAVGLWTLQPWGWWLAVFGLAIGLAANLMPLMQGAGTDRMAVLSVLDAAFLAYLLTPQIRAFYVSASA
jgi:hypothetical protein